MYKIKYLTQEEANFIKSTGIIACQMCVFADVGQTNSYSYGCRKRLFAATESSKDCSQRAYEGSNGMDFWEWYWTYEDDQTGGNEP